MNVGDCCSEGAGVPPPGHDDANSQMTAGLSERSSSIAFDDPVMVVEDSAAFDFPAIVEP